jgi:hypothetical protein
MARMRNAIFCGVIFIFLCGLGGCGGDSTSAASGPVPAVRTAAAVSTGTSTTYLVEGALLSGNVVISRDHLNYLGQGFASNFWSTGDGVTFTVNADAAADYDVGLRYLNARGTNQILSVYVNGAKVLQTTLTPLPDWNTWGVRSERLTLRVGSNTVAYRMDLGDTGQVNLNSIAVAPASGTPPPPSPPPTGTWTQCAVEWGVCTFSGTAQVRYGLNGTYAIKTATGSIACNNQVFGDPLPGADKICEYSSGATPPPTGPMTMSCVDGPATQCSGDSIIRTDNGVALTRSGVQSYGKSTSDLRNPIPDTTTATGMMLASGGVAEIRVGKDAGGIVSNPVLLLSNFGLTWDGKVERPTIVETFRTTQGRVQQDASSAITSGALAVSSNIGFYDFAVKGVAGTQVNYANNAYFPRSEPSRCDISPCRTLETTGPEYQAGDWTSGGNVPNQMHVFRLHEDGDVHAGNGLPDVNGNPTILPGGNGFGVPFPGSKGGRDFYNWSYGYGNLTAWQTQDTVQIGNWGALNEHNKIRRGTVAFGATSDPAAVPVAGTAIYAGVAYGWYVPNAIDDVVFFRAQASISANFATRSVTVTIQNAGRVFAPAGSVPVTFNAVTALGASGTAIANYLTGTVNNGTLAGGLGGRYFGPIVTAGSSGAGPAEIGGSFSLSNASSGQAVVGGFIARKQ